MKVYLHTLYWTAKSNSSNGSMLPQMEKNIISSKAQSKLIAVFLELPGRLIQLIIISNIFFICKLNCLFIICSFRLLCFIFNITVYKNLQMLLCHCQSRNFIIPHKVNQAWILVSCGIGVEYRFFCISYNLVAALVFILNYIIFLVIIPECWGSSEKSIFRVSSRIGQCYSINKF